MGRRIRGFGLLLVIITMTTSAWASNLPHNAKPLLLDLLDQYRGQWVHPSWLGQTLELPGLVGGLFEAVSVAAAPARLGVVVTPSSAPDDWERATLHWLKAEAGLYTYEEPHWRFKARLVSGGSNCQRVELTDLWFNQAFYSEECLAGLVLERPGGGFVPFTLLPAGAGPAYRLETDEVGHLAVGQDSLQVRLLALGPVSKGLRLEVNDKLTGESVGNYPLELPLGAGEFGTTKIKVKLPRYGVFETCLYDATGKELACLRLTRVKTPRKDMTPEESSFGINLFQHQLWAYTFQFPLIQATGAKWVRPWLAWENTWRTQEPEPGVYDFTQLDNTIARCEQLGLEYEAILFSSPERIGGSGLLQTPPPPDKLRLWGDWVRALATHFRGRIRHYEAWNEPDMMWPGTAGENADQYADLLEVTRRAAKTADPDCFIDAPSSAGYRHWLRDTVKLGAPDKTDVFTFHTYSPPSTVLHHIRTRLDLWGGAEGWDKPAWLNEIGASACDLNPDFNQKVGTDELAQAQLLIGDMALFLSERPTDKVFWFCTLDPHDPFHEQPWGQGGYVGDAAIGLLYEGLLPKIGYAAFAALTKAFDGRRALGAWEAAPGLRVIAFSGRRAIVLDEALGKAPERKATDLGCAPGEQLTVLDLYGNVLADGKASELTLDLSHGPLFLLGSAALERLGNTWGVLTKLRPSSLMAAGSTGIRTALLPKGATVSYEVLQSEPRVQVSLATEGDEATLRISATEETEHALAFARLTLRQDEKLLSQVFPITVGALPAFDDPGFTRDITGLWNSEREGTIAWTPEAGHLAPGCLEISAPYNGRIVNWQQWYLRLKPNLPLYWSVWVKAEGLRLANCQIALARFGEGKWLGDTVLMGPGLCPKGDSEWVKLEGKINSDDWPEGFTNAALYVDVWKAEGSEPEGRLLVDELDLWQPEE